jgi:uncharacterized protein (TIGR00255 family)
MSVQSMTGFGRAEGASGEWSWAVEARSVNGRNLELRFRGPTGFDGLERQAREAAGKLFQRGQLNLTVQAVRTSDQPRVRVNHLVLEGYLEVCERLSAAGRGHAPRLDGLLALPGVVETLDAEQDQEERARIEAAMAATIGEALVRLEASRRDEGARLQAILTGLLARLEDLVHGAGAGAREQPGLIKARFERRLAELLGEGVEAARIVQEAATLAARADVREELDRLAAHVGSAQELLGQSGATGRKLDFLTQEFMREANTLCSKSA